MLAVGIAPFVFPFLNFVYEMMISSSWTFAEWMILYSFVLIDECLSKASLGSDFI